VLVRAGIVRQRFRREGHLHEGGRRGFDIGVEDPVHDGPVIDRVSICILRIGIRRPPFQRGDAVARGQKIVRPDMRRRARRGSQLTQQLLAIVRISVVRLVIAEPVPQRMVRTCRFTGVDRHGHASRLGHLNFSSGTGTLPGAILVSWPTSVHQMPETYR
jgi:hypothetical protein